MTEIYVVGYDGSESSGRALACAVDRAAQSRATLVVAHVLEWSPYSFLTAEELEERHARRQEELQRAEKIVVAPVMAELAKKKVKAKSEIRYGHGAEVLIQIAKEAKACQIFIGRRGSTGLTARLFGAVAIGLVQASPVPVTVVP